MAKDLSAPYDAGHRDKSWLKFKPANTWTWWCWRWSREADATRGG